MQTSLPCRCEGRCVRSVVCLDQRISTAIKSVEKLSMKRLSSKSPTLSSSKPSLGIEKYYGETKRAWPLNATSNPDKGAEPIAEQRKSGGSSNVLSVIGGVIFNMIKSIMILLSLQKNIFAKFEDKIEKAAGMVEKVVDTVEQVANFTEDIAEKVEQQSKDGAVIHEAAEFLDRLSEKVSMEAKIVDNAAEQIKDSSKSIGTDMKAAEDAVHNVDDSLSKAVETGEAKPIGTQNSLDPEIVAKNE